MRAIVSVALPNLSNRRPHPHLACPPRAPPPPSGGPRNHQDSGGQASLRGQGQGAPGCAILGTKPALRRQGATKGRACSPGRGQGAYSGTGGCQRGDGSTCGEGISGGVGGGAASQSKGAFGWCLGFWSLCPPDTRHEVPRLGCVDCCTLT